MDKSNRRYDGMETILQTIHKKYVGLSSSEINRNNRLLNKILNTIIPKMREKDSLFNRLYQEIYFGGSYYNGLKVGSPNEYDIDLLLKFPSTARPEIFTSDIPGFVDVYLYNYEGFTNLCEFGNVHTKEVSKWIEGILQQVLNDFPQYGSGYSLAQIGYEYHYLTCHKAGPAFTLHVEGVFENERVDIGIDLVPCFVFDADMWPNNEFRPNESSKRFFVVPKYPNYPTIDASKHWRLSFQEQENIIINRKEKLKPALRLLKKMRDVMGHSKISSYYIKTIGLWEADDTDYDTWSTWSLSYTFMRILRKYKEHLNEKNIPYFWQSEFNLLDGIHSNTLDNINNHLGRIINNIERNISNNPSVVAAYLLTAEEQELFDASQETLMEEPTPPSCTIL